MRIVTGSRLVIATAVALLPAIALAGPPLVCHPFQTPTGQLLPWGDGPGWNTPDGDYDVGQLTRDTLALLTSDAPVLSRMENMRRAVIYAARDQQAAADLLRAVVARAEREQTNRLAIFDAGYLIESFKQARHMYRQTVTTADGYAKVRQAIQMGPAVPEMEFAAALMTEGPTSAAHLQRARAASASESLLARNIRALDW